MSDIKDLHDWNDNREDGFHLNISKPFGQLNEIEIRDLLEKIVERQNFTIDKIIPIISYISFIMGFSIFQILFLKQKSFFNCYVH